MSPTTRAYIALFALLAFSCSPAHDKASQTDTQKNIYEFDIRNLTDDEYPDNPDIGFRSENYHAKLFSNGTLELGTDTSISFYTIQSDTIQISHLNLFEYIPTIPKNVQKDEYLSYITCINQEWNRNQVRFGQGEYSSSKDEITRVDLARNCLNAYLWEVIIYVQEKGSEVPYAHGWFNFPRELYAKLFDERNSRPYNDFRAALENWVDPESKVVDFSLLRSPIEAVEVSFADQSESMYPVDGARKKKFKEIIHPVEFSTMRDLQSDSTLFATFTPPGYYNKKDPRTTELGRIKELIDIELIKTMNDKGADTTYELKLTFTDADDNRTTKLIFGGLNFNDFPVLAPAEANSGWKSSMGIANHSFYEDYKSHLANSTKTNPYYALITDENDKWLDSHRIGVDGPIFHFVDDGRTELHLWLLSFERHALVGHYAIQLN